MGAVPLRSLERSGIAPEAVSVRFWRQVDRRGDSECWAWLGSVGKRGYGRFTAGSRVDRSVRKLPSHRTAWEITNGPIPDGLFVLHRCDNRRCCNPDHLWLGTHLDNMADMRAKGRRLGKSAIGSAVKGSKLTEEQVSQLRALHPHLGYGAIAKRFGIAKSTARDIIVRKWWRHVA